MHLAVTVPLLDGVILSNQVLMVTQSVGLAAIWLYIPWLVPIVALLAAMIRHKLPARQ